MNQMLITLPFIVYAMVIIVVLAASDPRRKQSSGKTSETNTLKFELSSLQRKLLAWCLIFPLIVLAVMANYAGILMYAGALTVLGWVVSEVPTSMI